MLRRIEIRKFAVIDTLDLDLRDGLTVLSGETGAGKSIIVGALHLILGGRASPDLIRTGSDQAEVTAWFAWPSHESALDLLLSLGIETDAELILRRQIVREGRSRAWINDHPVSASTLSQLSESLVDISSQHQHQNLLMENMHIDLLDSAGDLWSYREAYYSDYERLKLLAEERKNLKAAAEKRLEREDFLSFQLEELKKADVKPGEEDELEKEREWLRHAEKIRGALEKSLQWLDGDAPIVTSVSKAEKELDRAAAHSSEAAKLIDRLQSTRIELEDIIESLHDQFGKAEGDPNRLDSVEHRLTLLSRLLAKHGPTSVDLINKIYNIENELNNLRDVDHSITELDKKIKEQGRRASEKAGVLSSERKKAAKKLENDVVSHLSDLGMKKTTFVVEIVKRSEEGEVDVVTETSTLGPSGADDVRFLISPNPGELPKPIAKIASGGELSRVMLAIKSVLLGEDPAVLSVFDEVDAGIGGAVGQMVGRKIFELSQKRQVICITHLPQIAAFANNHFCVNKESSRNRTFTKVISLGETSERIKELARMMTGNHSGSRALDAARELLDATGNFAVNIGKSN